VALPGINLVIKDQFLGVSRTDVTISPRVAIIGKRRSAVDPATPGNIYATSSAAGYTPFSHPDYPSTVNLSSDAPDLDPVNPINEQQVINWYGIGSDLHRGYIEAQRAGATMITLIPLPADTVYNHTNATISSATYTASAGASADLFADAFSAAESAKADIIVPWGRGSVSTEFEATPNTGNDWSHFGFYADNSSNAANSWITKVAKQCERITADSHPCMAIMGIKPYIGASTATGSMTPAQVVSHLTLPNLANRNELNGIVNNTVQVDGKTITTYIGHYVTVVAAEIVPLRYNGTINYGYANGAATYAGAITKLDSWSSTTNKTIFNVEKMRYNPTRSTLLSLVDKGIVPISVNFAKDPVWVDGQTFAKDGSDYRRLTTLRIVYDAVLLIRQASSKFIGEPASSATRNALETSITSKLRGMQQMGALLASDFTVTYIGVENKAIIDLVLQPAFELRNIEVRVSV